MKGKPVLYKTLVVGVIVLFIGISIDSSTIGIAVDITSIKNFLESANNPKDRLSCDHKAFIYGEGPYCEAWEFILNNPTDLTCICEGGGGSGDFFSGGTWSNDGIILTCQYDSGILYGLDVDSCEMWTIGGGGNSIVDLAFDPITNKMYGSSYNNCLFSINTETGEQNEIGPFGGSAGYMYMAFDAEGILYGWDLYSDKLWTIDTETGEATEVGSLGINLNYVCEGDFCKEDNIFYICIPLPPDNTYQLYESDPETGWSHIGQFPEDVDIRTFVIPWNYPPCIPYAPIPHNGSINVPIDVNLSWICCDPDGDSLTYDVYLDIVSPPEEKVSDDQTETTFDPGILEFESTYYWQIIGLDEHNTSTAGPVWHFTTEVNSPPDAPTIDGPVSGQEGKTYTFTFSSSDPNSDDIANYTINWGQGPYEILEGPFTSGSLVTANHTWTSKRTFTITAKAKDKWGAESDWAYFDIEIPRNRATTYLWLFERFPMLERLLTFLLL